MIFPLEVKNFFRAFGAVLNYFKIAIFWTKFGLILENFSQFFKEKGPFLKKILPAALFFNNYKVFDNENGFWGKRAQKIIIFCLKKHEKS